MTSLNSILKTLKTFSDSPSTPNCNYTVNQAVIPKRITASDNKKNQNVLLVMYDQSVLLELLPKKFIDSLPGYNALKNIGINFTNYHTNRQMCSPSRAVYMSGKVDCAINDNVEQPWQSACKQDVKDFNSIGKLFRNNAPNYMTAFFGKSHLDTKLIPNIQIHPRHTSNTSHAMKSYGIDKMQTHGDQLSMRHGIYSDANTYNFSLAIDAITHDIEENGLKLEGALPFLKARACDKINFFCEVNFHNPHDIQHFWTVPTQQPIPSGDMMQYGVPYYKQQLNDGFLSNELNNPITGNPIGNNIYKFDNEFEDAFIKNVSMKDNWFKVFGDETYDDYKTNTSTLLFKDTIEKSFWDSDTNNEVNPFYWGVYYLLYSNFTIPRNPFTDSTQIVFWKNYQNAYLTMITHVDLYLKNLIDYVISSGLIDNTSIILTSDHGDAVGAKGMIQKGFAIRQTENIPLCIYSPLLDKSLKGTTTDKLCSTIDINPTIMTLSNIDNPIINNMDGKSIFNKNNKGKLILNDNADDATFQILDNWQVFTSIFYIKGSNDSSAEYNSPSYEVWYDLKKVLPMTYPYKQLCFNTFVDGKKYKFVIWYSWLATMKYTNNLTSSFNNEELELVRQHINKAFPEQSSKFNEIIDTYVRPILDKKNNLKKIEIIEALVDGGASQVVNFILFEISLLIASIRENKIDNLPSFGHPLSSGTFDEYISVVNDKKLVFQQLYNLDEDPHELINLVDFKRCESTRNKNNNLIKEKIWEKMRKVIIDKNYDTLKCTTKFIEIYYEELIKLIGNKVSDFSELSYEKLQAFISSPSKNNAGITIFDNIY